MGSTIGQPAFLGGSVVKGVVLAVRKRPYLLILREYVKKTLTVSNWNVISKYLDK
jgi:hypothetical protein